MTGSALVITRLSRVAMNIGSEAATIASHTGALRASACRGAGLRGVDPGSGERWSCRAPCKKALNDYLCSDLK